MASTSNNKRTILRECIFARLAATTLNIVKGREQPIAPAVIVRRVSEEFTDDESVSLAGDNFFFWVYEIAAVTASNLDTVDEHIETAQAEVDEAIGGIDRDADGNDINGRASWWPDFIESVVYSGAEIQYEVEAAKDLAAVVLRYGFVVNHEPGLPNTS